MQTAQSIYRSEQKMRVVYKGFCWEETRALERGPTDLIEGPDRASAVRSREVFCGYEERFCSDALS